MRYTLNYSLLSSIMADTQKPYASGESKMFLQKLRLANCVEEHVYAWCIFPSLPPLPHRRLLEGILLHAMVAR